MLQSAWKYSVYADNRKLDIKFIIKSAVKQGILEAYKIIKNDKDKNIL